MKISESELNRVVASVIESWKKNNVLQLKADEKTVQARAVKALQEDLAREAALDREVLAMLDKLEKSHGGEFQRHKMHTMLKQKLAQERKVIL